MSSFELIPSEPPKGGGAGRGRPLLYKEIIDAFVASGDPSSKVNLKDIEIKQATLVNALKREITEAELPIKVKNSKDGVWLKLTE